MEVRPGPFAVTSRRTSDALAHHPSRRSLWWVGMLLILSWRLPADPERRMKPYGP